MLKYVCKFHLFKNALIEFFFIKLLYYEIEMKIMKNNLDRIIMEFEEIFQK